MGIDHLDLQFQLEKRFGVRFRRAEMFARARRRVPPDTSVGELHEYVCRKLRRLGRPAPPDSWQAVREVVARTLSVKVDEVGEESLLVRDLGAG